MDMSVLLGRRVDVDFVEARLIEAVRVFEWGAHSGQARAWAGDGPWHLSRRRIAENWAGLYSPRDETEALGHSIAQAVMNPRPDRDMIERAEAASAWLVFVPERDRRMVLLVLRALSYGFSQPPWARIKRVLGFQVAEMSKVRGAARGSVEALPSHSGLRMRYRRALDAVVSALERQTRGKHSL